MKFGSVWKLAIACVASGFILFDSSAQGGNRKPPTLSPMGDWWGTYTCSGKTMFAELKVRRDFHVDGKMAISFGFNDNDGRNGRMFMSDGSYTLGMAFDPERGAIKATPLQWETYNRDYQMVGMTLRMVSWSRIEGRIDNPACGAITLDRANTLGGGTKETHAAEAQGPTPRGEALRFPNVLLAATLGLKAHWDFGDSCRPPAADIRITEVSKGALSDRRTWDEFAERVATSVLFSCPGATELDVSVRAHDALPGKFEYHGVWDARQWRTWTLDQALLAQAPRRGATPPPPFTASVDTLPQTGRAAAATARLKAARPQLEAAVARAYQAANLGRSPIYRPSELARFADTICVRDDDKVDRSKPARLQQSACYVSALWSGGFLARQPDDRHTQFWRSTSGEHEFARCFWRGGPMNCALLAELMFEAVPLEERLIFIRDARVANPRPVGDFEAEVVAALKDVAAAASGDLNMCVSRQTAVFRAEPWGTKRLSVCMDANPKFDRCEDDVGVTVCTYTCVLVLPMEAADYCAQATCDLGVGDAKGSCDGAFARYREQTSTHNASIIRKPTVH